jgi:hypothetical protein
VTLSEMHALAVLDSDGVLLSLLVGDKLTVIEGLPEELLICERLAEGSGDVLLLTDVLALSEKDRKDEGDSSEECDRDAADEALGEIVVVTVSDAVTDRLCDDVADDDRDAAGEALVDIEGEPLAEGDGVGEGPWSVDRARSVVPPKAFGNKIDTTNSVDVVCGRTAMP